MSSQNQGKLKERIVATQLSMGGGNTMHLHRTEDILPILDEAKQDFPNIKNTQYKKAPGHPDLNMISQNLEYILDIFKWKEKWFGSAGETP